MHFKSLINVIHSFQQLVSNKPTNLVCYFRNHKERCVEGRKPNSKILFSG